MQRNILTILTLLVMFVQTNFAQVNVSAKIDSVTMFVGEQTVISLKASMNKKQVVEFPHLKDKEIVRGLEVVDESEVDTTLEADKIVVTKKYTVTAFDSAMFYIPPFSMKSGAKTYTTKSLALKVLTIDVDTLKLDSFNSIKPVMEPPFYWEDWYGIIMLSLLAAILFAAFCYLYLVKKDNRPIIRHIKLKPSIPPHKWAIKEIEKIKSETELKEENSKEYYTKLTDTLRTYINKRYGFNAMEMTTGEIIEHLMAVEDTKALDELQTLLTTADMVKFAKYNVPINENDANLINAIDFVNSTKQEITEESLKQVKPEVTKEEKRSKKMSFTLTISLVVLGIMIVSALAYILYRVYCLMF